MKYSVLALLAGLAVVSPIRAQVPDAATVVASPAPETAAPEPHYIAGKWTYPTAEQAANFYPAKAMDEQKGGEATIDCELDHEGYVVECRILAEDPKGYDFGYMTASMFINYARVDPASVEGGIKDGDRKKFTYKWMV